MFLDLEAGTGEEIRLCTENIEWAKNENRTFLRQALEVFTLFHSINIFYDLFLYFITGSSYWFIL